MKKLLISIIAFCFVIISNVYAQQIFRGQIESGEVFTKELMNTGMIDKRKAAEFCSSLVVNDRTIQSENLLNENGLDYKKYLVYLIIPQFSVQDSTPVDDSSVVYQNITEKEVLMPITIHKKGKKFSDHFTGIKKILIITLGNQEDLKFIKISSVPEESALSQNIYKFGKAFTKITLPGGISEAFWGLVEQPETVSKPENLFLPDSLDYRIYSFDYDDDDYSIPCTFKIALPENKDKEKDKDGDKEKEFSFRISEKNMLLLKVGIATNLVKSHHFSFSDSHFVVNPDSAQREDWIDRATLLFDLHWPRDDQSFDPPFWPIWKDFKYRVSAITGCEISMKPFDTIYFGFSYAITKNIGIAAGKSYTRVPVSGTTFIGDNYDYDNAAEFAEKKYAKSEVFYALTFSPSAMLDALFPEKETDDKKSK